MNWRSGDVNQVSFMSSSNINSSTMKKALVSDFLHSCLKEYSKDTTGCNFNATRLMKVDELPFHSELFFLFKKLLRLYWYCCFLSLFLFYSCLFFVIIKKREKTDLLELPGHHSINVTSMSWNRILRNFIAPITEIRANAKGDLDQLTLPLA